MKLLFVSVGVPRDIVSNGRTITTGIYKHSVAGRVRVRTLNIDGDRQADLSVHGGIDKAVYAYPQEHYPFWENELGRHELPPGQFGENLTTSGLLEEDVRIGDIFSIGSAHFEISQPREPCFKLALRTESPGILKRFIQTQRTGFYLRVVQEGDIGAGDQVTRLKTDPQQMTVKEVFDVAYGDSGSRENIERALQMPALADAWRDMFNKRLAAQ